MDIVFFHGYHFHLQTQRQFREQQFLVSFFVYQQFWRDACVADSLPLLATSNNFLSQETNGDSFLSWLFLPL